MATSEKDEEFDYIYKMVVIGESGVGKTNITTRFTSDEFSLDSKATIGVEFGHAEITLPENIKVKIQIWDTAGQERFRAISGAYYRGSVGALLVYDITDYKSFQRIEKWITELEDYAEKDPVVMLVGNKIDKEENRVVPTDEAKKAASKHGLLFIETSALDGVNIKEAFFQTVQEIHRRRAKKKTQGSDVECVEESAKPSRGFKIEEQSTKPESTSRSCPC